MPIFKLNAVMVIVSCSTTEAARLKMVGPSTRRAANFLKRGRLSILWPNAYLLDVLTDFEDPLKTVCFTEENGLPPRQYDFFSVP